MLALIECWCNLQLLREATLTVPMLETLLLFVVLTLCLLFRFTRTGLLVAYLFVYRWGWQSEFAQAFPNPRWQAWFSTGYIICGILAFTFAVISMLYANRRE